MQADQAQSIELPATSASAVHTVSFRRTLRRLTEPTARRLFALWLLLCVVVVPTGAFTRFFEWTGLAVTIGGVEVYLTLYLPLVACVPLVLWLGYLWGAIPAYLSTFGVALLGGMPIGWIFVFSLANPVGLAAFYLAYRALPLRVDLRTWASLTYYLLVLFVSSLAGSAGSFVWAHTNRVGLNEFYPVWQGWWLGGFVQGALIVGPLLFLATPAVERWKTNSDLIISKRTEWDRRLILLGAIAMIATIVAYVAVVRRFMAAALADAIASVPEASALERQLRNIMAGLTLPQWVLVTLVSVALFFGFRLGVLWSERYRELATRLEDANQELRHAVMTDHLTGAFSRSYLLETLAREINRHHRHGQPLVCAVIDIDHFKQVNDGHGHLEGDRVLRHVVSAISSRVRREDTVARFGGEEFVVLMPATDLAGATAVAEDMRQRVGELKFVNEGTTFNVTVSIGIALLGSELVDHPVRRLLARADEALYRAKSLGRNRVVVARPDAGAPDDG